MSKQKTFDTRVVELLAFARAKHTEVKYWIDLHNAIFELGGKTYELFPTREQRVRLMKHDVITEIRKLVESLPAPPTQASLKFQDAGGRILLRVPKSLHLALLAEAEAEKISLNQLLLVKVSLPLRS